MHVQFGFSESARTGSGARHPNSSDGVGTEDLRDSALYIPSSPTKIITQKKNDISSKTSFLPKPGGCAEAACSAFEGASPMLTANPYCRRYERHPSKSYCRRRCVLNECAPRLRLQP